MCDAKCMMLVLRQGTTARLRIGTVLSKDDQHIVADIAMYCCSSGYFAISLPLLCHYFATLPVTMHVLRELCTSQAARHPSKLPTVHQGQCWQGWNHSKS